MKLFILLRKYLMLIISNILYGLGHATSRILVDLWPDLFYPMYNNLMYWSSKIDEKYKLGGWTRVTYPGIPTRIPSFDAQKAARFLFHWENISKKRKKGYTLGVHHLIRNIATGNDIQKGFNKTVNAKKLTNGRRVDEGLFIALNTLNYISELARRKTGGHKLLSFEQNYLDNSLKPFCDPLGISKDALTIEDLVSIPFIKYNFNSKTGSVSNIEFTEIEND